MSAIASYSQAREGLDRSHASCRQKMAVALVLGGGLAVAIVSAAVCSDKNVDHQNSIDSALPADHGATNADLQLSRLNPETMRATVVGTASVYNPFRHKYLSGGKQTSSGEPYDPAAWAAAIQIDLRDQFGGVRFGKNYRPTYALLECTGRRAIIKINDVGPLRPGRVINLDERSMRYCDPSRRAGLIDDVRVTLLPGKDWTPGPLRMEQFVSAAAGRALAEEPEVTVGQVASIAAKQLAGEARNVETTASRHRASAVYAPHRLNQYILISAIGGLVALLATVLKKAPDGKHHAAKPRSKSRRKTRRKDPRLGRRTGGKHHKRMRGKRRRAID